MLQNTSSLSPNTTATGLPELNLPFSLERASLLAEKCVLCKYPICVEACPETVDIPGCLKAMMEGLDLLSNTLRTKVDFLNTISHDLRTPLNVVVGNIGLIQDGFCGYLTPELSKAVQVIKRSAEELLTMLNQLLNFSRFEAGAVSLQIEEFSLADLVSELGAGISVLCRAKGLDFKWEVEGDSAVRSDSQKIKEILNNLLTNAVKYTDKGHVYLRAGLEPTGDGVWFEVADSGRGIPREELPHVFESFRQVGASSAHSQGGVGLGLAIVKRLLDLLGGRIEVESTLNEGSTFRVVVPRVCKLKTNGVSALKA